MAKVYRTVINKTMTSKKILEQYFYVIYENIITSILTDIATFSCISLAFWFNHCYIGSRAFSILLFISFFVSIQEHFNSEIQDMNPVDFVETFLNHYKEGNDGIE